MGFAAPYSLWRLVPLTLWGITTFAFWIVIGAFALWSYRKARLRSGLWLVAWGGVTLLTSFLSPTWMSRLSRYYVQGHHLMWGENPASVTMTWSLLGRTVEQVAFLMACLLVLADILHLAAAAGVDTSGPLLQRMARIHRYQTAWGVALLILSVLYPAAMLLCLASLP